MHLCGPADIYVLFFGVVYLAWCYEMLTKSRKKSATETLVMIRQMFQEESMIRKRKVPTRRTSLCFSDWRWNWKAAILTQLRWSRQIRRRCWTPPQNKTSRIHLKIGRSAGNGTYARKRNTWRVMAASRPNVSFWSNDSTSPGNYGWL
jgi:hypothetical protein